MRREVRELDEDARDDLVEAREALIGEIVELERAYRRGDVGPKTYGRIRAALLDSLARIVAMLEAGPAKPAQQGSAPPKVTPKRPPTARPRPAEPR